MQELRFDANGESVATTAGAEAIVRHALERWGRVDILINNAGIVSGAGPLWNVTDEQWASDIGVAASGTFHMCRAVWKPLWEANYGRIVNVASGSFFGMGSGVGGGGFARVFVGVSKGYCGTNKNLTI